MNDVNKEREDWVDCGDCPVISTGCKAGTCVRARAGLKAESTALVAQAVPEGSALAVLVAHAEARVHHAYNGSCPEEAGPHEQRDPECPVCAALVALKAEYAAQSEKYCDDHCTWLDHDPACKFGAMDALVTAPTPLAAIIAEQKTLAAALLWARNHLDVGVLEHRDRVIEALDRVLEGRAPTVADMRNFREMYGIRETQAARSRDGHV